MTMKPSDLLRKLSEHTLHYGEQQEAAMVLAGVLVRCTDCGETITHPLQWTFCPHCGGKETWKAPRP